MKLGARSGRGLRVSQSDGRLVIEEELSSLLYFQSPDVNARKAGGRWYCCIPLSKEHEAGLWREADLSVECKILQQNMSEATFVTIE